MPPDPSVITRRRSSFSSDSRTTQLSAPTARTARPSSSITTSPWIRMQRRRSSTYFWMVRSPLCQPDCSVRFPRVLMVPLKFPLMPSIRHEASCASTAIRGSGSGHESGPAGTPIGSGRESGPASTPIGSGHESGPDSTPIGSGHETGPAGTPIGSGHESGPAGTPAGSSTLGGLTGAGSAAISGTGLGAVASWETTGTGWAVAAETPRAVIRISTTAEATGVARTGWGRRMAMILLSS